MLKFSIVLLDTERPSESRASVYWRAEYATETLPRIPLNAGGRAPPAPHLQKRARISPKLDLASFILYAVAEPRNELRSI